MNPIKPIISALVIALLFSCNKQEPTLVFFVKNTLNVKRSYETITLTKVFLKTEDLTNIGIQDMETGTLQVTQLVDNNGDGVMDDLLFQPQMPPKSEKKYKRISLQENEAPKSMDYCYSRFVPERIDDYTWENDKVAFRVYGPVAQKMVEDSVPGGIISSGVDAWLKKVDYPVINKWYKKTIEKTGSYHEDTGEGMDNFHVGVSRGVGGLAIKVDSTYFYSKNYTKWRTITTGPIRTSFHLEYASWDAAGKTITESKVISLDKGNNFSKFEISLTGTDRASAGLTLHEKDGEVSVNEKEGWVSYWQPHGDSELGTAIIAAPETFLGYEKYDVETKDLSSAYAHLRVKNNTATYYAGFGWKERGLFKTKTAWESHLKEFTEKLNNPLQVTLIE